MTPDSFELLGVQRQLNLSLPDLESKFYEQSRKLHPDKFARKSAAEQQQALDASSLLNDAYRTLKDPLKRAEYLLQQEGFDIGEQRSKDVPAELLEEVFELNMALEEMRGGDASARPQLEAARSNFTGMLAQTDSELQDRFRAWDASGQREELSRIRGLLNRRRYIRNLVNEVEKELNQ